MRLNNSNKIFTMSKMWYRKSSRIGYFHNIKHNSNAYVRIESQNGKHVSEFSISTYRSNDIDVIHENHSGHEYKLPKFVMKFVKEQHDEREASPRMQANIVSDSMDEDNDCSVKAIAVAAGVSYKKAHDVCKARGRVKGHGLRYHTILDALETVATVAYQYRQHEHRVGGKDGEYVPAVKDKSVQTLSRMAKSIGAKRLTFNRLPDVICKDKNYIVMNAGHCAPVVGGVILDWSAGSKMLVTELIELK